MTEGALLLLLRCLDSQQLTVGSPDFEQVAIQVIQARRELVEEIERSVVTIPDVTAVASPS